MHQQFKISINSRLTMLCRFVPVILAFVISFLPGRLGAAERLAGIFADNMVLQRDRPVPVWGWAEKGQPISVTFGGQEKSTTAGETGRWMVKLDPMPADKAPRELTVKGSSSLIVRNVLVGDVWICAGQSNMSWFLQDSLNAKAEMAAANFPSLRFLKVAQGGNPVPLDDLASRAPWAVCSPVTDRMYISAVGFYFARELLKEIDVPIGLLGINYGGTCIETWIPPEGFRSVAELKELSRTVDSRYQDYFLKLKAWLPGAEAALSAQQKLPDFPASTWVSGDFQQPAKCFNAMVNPCVPYAIRGVIWYQGEGNGSEGETYFHKMQALTTGWRELWNQGDPSTGEGRTFPFYSVQLANFQKSDPDKPEGGDTWTRLREAQLKTLSIPNTGMAVSIDIGDSGTIHPQNKQDVGKRLALWALAKDYGKPVVYSGPLYKGYKVEGNRIRVEFDHVGGGLIVGEKTGLDPVTDLPAGKLKWFAIADKDRKWYWADAVIDGNTVLVSNPEVPFPSAVRYAFAFNPEGANLYNKEGLPASPFRTDDW